MNRFLFYSTCCFLLLGSMISLPAMVSAAEENLEKVAEKLGRTTVLVRMTYSTTVDKKAADKKSADKKAAAKPDATKQQGSKLTKPTRQTKSEKPQANSQQPTKINKETRKKDPVKSSATKTIELPPSKTKSPAVSKSASKTTASNVIICSGVVVGKKLVVSFISPRASSKFRITYPGGQRCEARLRVVDYYTGLSLLEVSQENKVWLDAAKIKPKIGSRIISAAAWGAEQPVLSVGILSASERTLPSVALPSLLECDLRTTSTSAGAPLVNPAGQLLGIIVSNAGDKQRSAHAYAVGVSHVQRLLRAKVDKKIVVLKRQRPVIGMDLGCKVANGPVCVLRVRRNSPAEKANIKKGDVILRADGKTIRYPYDAFRLILNRQPGDQLTFEVKKGTSTTKHVVTLAGGNVIDSPDDALVGRNLAGSGLNSGQIYGHRDKNKLHIENQGNHSTTNISQERQIKLLQKSLSSYHIYMKKLLEENARLKAELSRRDKQMKQQLDSLNQKLEKLSEK